MLIQVSVQEASSSVKERSVLASGAVGCLQAGTAVMRDISRTITISEIGAELRLSSSNGGESLPRAHNRQRILLFLFEKINKPPFFRFLNIDKHN